MMPTNEKQKTFFYHKLCSHEKEKKNFSSYEQVGKNLPFCFHYEHPWHRKNEDFILLRRKIFFY